MSVKIGRKSVNKILREILKQKKSPNREVKSLQELCAVNLDPSVFRIEFINPRRMRHLLIREWFRKFVDSALWVRDWPAVFQIKFRKLRFRAPSIIVRGRKNDGLVFIADIFCVP